MNKEDLKNYMVNECGSDESIASLIADSYTDEEVNQINSFNKDLLSFMAKRESKLMENILK
jgi:hypothetical protein